MIKNLKKLNICLIGAGKVGSALAFELFEKKFSLKYLIDGNRTNLKTFSLLFKNVLCDKKLKPDFIKNSDMIIISVQDKYLEKLAKEIKRSGLNFKNKYILHTSGFYTSDVFKKLNLEASNIGSFHPIQTFNNISVSNKHLLNNIYWGIEAGKKLEPILKKFSRIFDSKYILVPKKDKPLYHFACVYASNFLISYLNILDTLLKDTGIKPVKNINIFLPIISCTIQNINKKGLKNSLTGPFVRKDFKVIEGHLRFLEKKFKELIPIYLYFGKSAINLSSKKYDSSNKDLTTLKRILNKYENSFSLKK